MSLAVFGSSSSDPTTYEEAKLSTVWQKAMDAEMSAIERNCTWELVDLPPKVSPIELNGYSRPSSMKKVRWRNTRPDL